MCGIFGYIGNKDNAAQIVFNGLKTLEYRGYDSWGVTIPSPDGRLQVEKSVGKIGSTTLNFTSPSQMSIGHTRWATHGGVTHKNSHPHLDCHRNIAVVHNGIIDNYQALKSALIKRGHRFSSETDSEVVAHLLEDYTKDFSLQEAVSRVFKKLHGLNAIVAIQHNTKEIVATKNGSPLVIGVGDNEFFLASDPAGIAPFTQNIVYLNDNELVTLNGQMHIYSGTDLKELTPVVEKLSWNINHVVKGDFPHFMMKEIFEQPTIIETIANGMTKQVSDVSSIIKKAKDTFFIGCGTAYHACLAGTYLFSKIAKIHVNTAPASEFENIEGFIDKKSLVVSLSQSGETIDVVEPLNRAKEKDATTMTLVNVQGSTLYRLSDYKILLGAGIEKAVASTKAYMAKVSLLSLLAYSVAGKTEEGKTLLQESAKEIKRLLKPASLENIKNVAAKLTKKHSIYIIGRGMSYPTALEGALKIKEISYIHTEGFAGGELKHGTIALIEKGSPCIVLAPADDTHEAILSNAMEIKSRGGYIIGISPTNSPIFDEWIEVRAVGISLLTQIIPMQILAYYLAVLKKVDPDMPRNLAKSVTVR